MQISEYENIYKNEATHFYYIGNHNIVLSLVKRYLQVPRTKAKILDAGCGTGLLAKKLEKFGQVWAVDISPYAISFAKKRKIRIKRASVTRLPFKANTFNLVTSIDVIYHKAVEDDQKALKEFFRVLKPDGILIVRVPANRWLTRSADHHVYTRQRYDAEQLRKKLTRVGFGVQKLTSINLVLLPPAVLSMIWEGIKPPINTRSPLPKLPNTINWLLGKTLSFESTIIRVTNLPFGLGLLAVAKK